MAFNLENMTVDYKKLFRMIPSDRSALAQSGAISDLISSLTPGQLVNLFPRYYRDQLPDVGKSVASYGGALSGGTNLNGEGGGGNNTYTPYTPDTSKPIKSPSAEETAIQNLLHEANVLGEDAVKPGTEGLEPGIQQRMKMTYDAFTAAGFSHKQSLALTAEVGRENGYQEKFMFGTHSDPYNNATNLGMLSMQGPRLTNLKEALKAEGRFDVNGELIRDQETMNAMARFYMNEMQTSENTKKTQEFLNNTDIDPQRAAELLGRGYIRWRYDDPRYAKHHDYRNRYYNDIDNITAQYVENIESAGDEIGKLETVITKFDPGMIDQLDERMKKWYENAGEAQKKRFETALERLGVERFNQEMKRQPVNNTTIQAIATPEELSRIGGDAIVNPSENRVKQEQEVLAGTRKLPLQQDLVDIMNYSVQKLSEETGRNIYLKTFSGGQAALGSDGPRTGSTEHDLGGAADNYFIEVLPDGSERRLNMQNPDDKALMHKAAYHFVRAGGRSVGLESGYMGDESIHLGISRNNADPTHHADRELSAVVDQARSEFVQEAKANGWDERYGYKDFLLKEKMRRQEEYSKNAREAEAARLNSDPVTAAQNNVVPPEPLQQTPAPSPTAAVPDPVTAAQNNVQSSELQSSESPENTQPLSPVEVENTQPLSPVEVPTIDHDHDHDQPQPTTSAGGNTPELLPPTSAPITSPNEVTNTPVPSFSEGGTVEMPPATPGEGLAGIDVKTGEVKFMGNDRELYTQDNNGNLRIDPSTIRREDQKVEMASAEPQRTEPTNQPMQYKPQQPMPVSTPDTNFVSTMSSGSMASSPSQLRALNRAKLYGDSSGNLVNGHFS